MRDAPYPNKKIENFQKPWTMVYLDSEYWLGHIFMLNDNDTLPVVDTFTILSGFLCACVIQTENYSIQHCQESIP